MRVLFYSPFESAAAETPSGAARMAMQFRMAIEMAGCDVTAPSLPLTRDGVGDPDRQTELRVRAEQAADDLLSMIAQGRLVRPDVWFSYHVYYKAPDWIGPAVSASLGIPYVVAEGSHAPKRASGPWKQGHDGATRALEAADLILAMTGFDRQCLEILCPGRVRDFEPFIDVRAFRDPVEPRAFKGRLLAVGMMRNERKLQSYRLVADVMGLLPQHGYTLRIAGDGAFRGTVEGVLADAVTDGRVAFLGVLSPAALRAEMRESDILLWPGIGEAYGVTYLEAQASGLPVVACRNRGVVDVTCDGQTALLCAPGDGACMAGAVETLARDGARFARMRAAAWDYVHAERSLERASALLRAHLDRLVA